MKSFLSLENRGVCAIMDLQEMTALGVQKILTQRITAVAVLLTLLDTTRRVKHSV